MKTSAILVLLVASSASSLRNPRSPVELPSPNIGVRGGEIYKSVAPLMSPKGGYDKCVAVGIHKSTLPWKKIAMASIISGIHIGFGAYLALAVGGSIPKVAAENPGLQRIMYGSFGLPLGLFLTLIGGGQLFTGNTLFVTAAKIEGQTTWRNFGKNWSVSYIGNLIGAIFLAWLCTQSGTLHNTMSGHTAYAVYKTSLPFVQAFIRGALGNYLVCMAVLMATNANDVASKAFAVWLPISAFVAMGFEHCVANMFYIPFGMMNGADVTVRDFLIGNLLPVTLGNIVGGAVAVAGCYAYAFRSPTTTN